MTTVDSEIVVLDSRERSSGASAQTLTMDMIPSGGVQGTYEIMGYQSVNQVYSVEAGVNDSIYFDETGGLGNLTGTILPGNYATPALLFAAAKAAMELVGAETYTFAQDVATGLLTVSPGANLLGWEWGTNVASGDLANLLLGLLPVDVAGAASIEGTLIPDLRSHTHILLTIAEDNNHFVTIQDGSEFSLMVPLTVDFGDPIESVKQVTFQQTVRFINNISTLSISEFTEDGVALVNAPEYVLSLRRLF